MADRLSEAIVCAARWHADQWRDGDDPLPYVTHPIEVLTHLRHIGDVRDPDLLAAAVLHDVIEECGVEVAEIEERFGRRVAGLVQELTRVEPSPEELEGLDEEGIWQFRADRLVDEIAVMSPDAQRIKLADRLSNVRQAIATKPAKKAKRYVKQTRKILKTIDKDLNPGLWKAIAEVVEAYG